MDHNDLIFKYYTLKYVQIEQNVIPSTGGVYKWVYWPNLENYVENGNDYWDLLCVYSSKKLTEESSFNDFKFDITVVESSYNACNSNYDVPFGLSDAKGHVLKDFLQEKENRCELNRYLKPIVFSKPFYVGKADNLYARIKDHYSGNSKLLPYIRDQGINFEDIWIGYYVLNGVDNTKNTSNINDVFEEVLQRIVKPGLTKRPG